MILRYEQLNENKMWYKTIPQILEWIDSKSDLYWIWIDTETTGIGGPKKEQLTQVSAIVTNYNFNNNSFNEVDTFDRKIKLTSDIKSRYDIPGDNSRRILSFNHYGSGGYKYEEESEVVYDFFKWIEDYSPCLGIAQNASFDMNMLAGRSDNKIKFEVFDTKMLIQLYYLPLLQKLGETDSKYSEIVSSIGTSTRDNGLISSSMAKIGQALGLSMDNYHDAITDCRITIEMYRKIVDFLKENKHIDISKYQNDRIRTIRK